MSAFVRPVRLGTYFTLAEFERTGTGLPNVASPEAIVCMQALVKHVLDPLRADLGRPLRINSGFRSEAVNVAVDGSPTSAHKAGKAADVDADGLDAEQLACRVVALGLHALLAGQALPPTQLGAGRRDELLRQFYGGLAPVQAALASGVRA